MHFMLLKKLKVGIVSFADCFQKSIWHGVKENYSVFVLVVTYVHK